MLSLVFCQPEKTRHNGVTTPTATGESGATMTETCYYTKCCSSSILILGSGLGGGGSSR